MFTSQASGAATSAGCETKSVAEAGAISADETHIVVLDLTMPSLDIGSTVCLLKENKAKVVAVGPHVHEAKLAAARAANCDHVLTKGQASRELGAVLNNIVNESQ